MTNYMFDHEKLKVYSKSCDFIEWLQTILQNIEKKYAVYDQLDRASTSIPLNIAEGNGKFTGKDRCRFFDIARGSALECAAGLDILVAKKLLEKAEVLPGKEMLKDIVSMLVGLIKSNSERVLEEVVKYGEEEKE
jgi:four helix bundle protein